MTFIHEGIHMKASIRSVALIGVLALVLASCDSQADGPTNTAASNGATTTSSTTTLSIVVASPQDLLDRFASLWIDGDWAGMADIAEPGAVATAEEWGQADWVNVVWGPSCELESSGTGNCEMLIYPLDYDGYALIFSARYTQGAGGELSILELTFGGDAG
jgi:hypothetical protein